MRTNLVGIMQGRLSPPAAGRIQSFPVQTWRDEFHRAREAELDCIEWIYEEDTEAWNPLRTDAGIAEILQVADESGVAVRSICADYYMTQRLIAQDGRPRENVVQHLSWLVARAGALGIGHIVLPFVDASSLSSPAQLEGVHSVVESVVPEAQRVGVELHLETDLIPGDLVHLLKRISHPLVRANYDIGNSAALGHEPADELALLAPWLGSVHVKDRRLGGGTVPLGTGSADFPTTFRLIHAARFRGPFILQAAREQGPSETDLAKRNRQFVDGQLAAVMNV